MPFFRRSNLKDQHLSQDIRPDSVPALPGHPAQGLIAHGGEDRLTHVPLQRAGLHQIAEFGNDDFFGDFFSPMPSLLGRMNRMLESPFDDFFDAMPAIGAAPVQEVKEEKKDDLMSHEEQSRFSYLRQLNALKQKKAIHEENFERAAQLRDEIHKLEEAHKEAKESGKDSKESA